MSDRSPPVPLCRSQAQHVQMVLADPTGHGLQEGVWYCVDADEGMIERFGSHTLAGVLGCGPEHLGTLRNALEMSHLFYGNGAAIKEVSLRARLGLLCFRASRVDAYISTFSTHYIWIAFGSRPSYAPPLQLAGSSGVQRPSPISPRTRALQAGRAQTTSA